MISTHKYIRVKILSTCPTFPYILVLGQYFFLTPILLIKSMRISTFHMGQAMGKYGAWAP
jgi:hypothetical protein